MYNSIESIRERLDAGEDSVTEFKGIQLGKRSVISPNTESFAEEMVAFANAVAHRDYSISGSKIRLFMFADRLELYSPGDLPNTVTLENMPFRVFTRNQLLVSFLSRMKSKKTNQSYLESRGEGVMRIISESEAISGKKPEYKLLGQELLLTIWGPASQQENRT